MCISERLVLPYNSAFPTSSSWKVLEHMSDLNCPFQLQQWFHVYLIGIPWLGYQMWQEYSYCLWIQLFQSRKLSNGEILQILLWICPKHNWEPTLVNFELIENIYWRDICISRIAESARTFVKSIEMLHRPIGFFLVECCQFQRS